MRKKILWLVSWYPNKLDAFDGDFIQRHAQAASLYNDVHVIQVVADEKGVVTNSVYEEKNEAAGLTEHIIYFKKPASFFPRLLGFLKWKKLYKQSIKNYISKNGLPHVVHVHVPVKAGLLALWMKKKYGTKFIVTEHFGIYNKVDELNFAVRPAWFQQLTRSIFFAAEKFLTVSEYLGKGVNKFVLKKPFEIVPNVVNTELFYLKESTHARFRFIHVSNMALKNAEGILQAAKQLREQGNFFELVMVGNRNDHYLHYARQLGLDGSVIFKGEIPYQQVAAEMQQANAFILFSNIENSPCVIGEALCCGLPVIATRVGGIPELVNVQNGILVKPGDIPALVQAMQKIIENYNRFNQQEISQTAIEKFSYPVVGKKLDEIYQSAGSS